MGIYDIDFTKILQFILIQKTQIIHYISAHCTEQQVYPNFMQVYAIPLKSALAPLTFSSL